MSKAKNQAAPSLGSVTVTSMKDAGYQSAISDERKDSVARYVYSQCPNFTNEVSDEVKTQLRAGWALRWQELNPAVSYNDSWVPVENGSYVMTVDVCFSYSQQAFGQLKEADPVKHGVIKGIRDAFNKYASNRMADLKTAVRKVENEGKGIFYAKNRLGMSDKQENQNNNTYRIIDDTGTIDKISSTTSGATENP